MAKLQSQAQKQHLSKLHNHFQRAKEAISGISGALASIACPAVTRLTQTRTRELKQVEEDLLSAQVKERLVLVEKELKRMKEQLKTSEISFVAVRRVKDKNYQLFCTVRRSLQQSKASNSVLKMELSVHKAILTESNRKIRLLEVEIFHLVQSVHECDTIIAGLQARVHELEWKNKALRMQVGHAQISRDKACLKAKEAAICATWKLIRNGVYTPQARALTCQLVKAGVSQTRVGEIIFLITTCMGCTVKGVMSHRTVGRAVTEGGVAAKLQLAYELNSVKGLTASGNATSHKSTNYKSMHVTYVAPNYGDPLQPAIPATCLFAISSSVSHHSKTQVESWKKHISDICILFNRCPFSERAKITFNIPDFLCILKEMHEDHASNQKKTVKLMLAWKLEVVCMQLRWEYLATLSAAQLTEMLAEMKMKCVDDAGGFGEWLKLNEDETSSCYKAAMDTLALKLGQEKYEKLPEADKREIDTFFWAGCSMHRELNSVVGGYASCTKFWEDSELDPPVMLVNKDNDATIKLVALLGSTSDAAECAVKASERGAVKLTQLAGSLFHHKDDKKGYQDQHRDYFQNIIKENSQFPDVSNTRYHSTCLAVCRIILHLRHYHTFLETMRDQKTKPGFNHMEENVYKALHDILTLTELTVLCLYYLTVTSPYSIAVRGPGTEKLNMLELGPLHKKLKTHIEKLINEPELVIGNATTAPCAHEATLDGKEWLDVCVIEAMISLKSELPHLSRCFIAFLKGMQETWKHFTSKFAPDGPIAQATAEERQLAFMPSTNNANEGALGMWRKWA